MKGMRLEDLFAEYETMVNRIRPLLAGQPPQITVLALADLLAIWLAGHEVKGDKNATQALRAQLLAGFCEAVRELVSTNAKILGTTP